MEKYTVGVDFGTLSARAVIVSNETGKIVSSSEYSYPHGVMTESLPGGAPLGENFALQHPKDYVAALGAAVRTVIEESGDKSRKYQRNRDGLYFVHDASDRSGRKTALLKGRVYERAARIRKTLEASRC